MSTNIIYCYSGTGNCLDMARTSPMSSVTPTSS